MHGRRQREQGRRGPLWIFMHNTDKREGGLMVLFFDLVFFRCPPPGNFSADAFDVMHCFIFILAGNFE